MTFSWHCSSAAEMVWTYQENVRIKLPKHGILYGKKNRKFRLKSSFIDVILVMTGEMGLNEKNWRD